MKENPEFENFEQKVVEAYLEYKKKLDDPNIPILYSIGAKSWTVDQIISEIKQETPFAVHELESLRGFAIRHPDVGVRGVLKMIRREPLEEGEDK